MKRKGFFLIEFALYSSILSLMMFGLVISSLAFHDSLSRAAIAASNESAGTEIVSSLEQEFDAHLPLIMPDASGLPAGAALSPLSSSTTIIGSEAVSTFSFTYDNENFSFTKMNR